MQHQKICSSVARSLSVVLIFLGLFTLFPAQVQAKSYEIEDVNIRAVLHKTDGSMDVTEQRTYDFDGEYTFAYIYINKHPDQSKDPGRTEQYILEDFAVCEPSNCYRLLQASEMGNADSLRPENTFYVRDESSRYYIKWFYRAYSEDRTFVLKYKVKNAITLHTDTAELYWKFIGDDWEISQGRTEIFVGMPSGISANDVQAFAHGPLNGTVSISNQPSGPQTVRLFAPSISSKQFFEARILFPSQGVLGGAKGT